MIKEHLFIVFCVEHYNPLGIIRSLGENGIRPVVIILESKKKLASRSKYISKLVYVHSIEEGYGILMKEYGVLKEKKPFLFTADDQITSFLDRHYQELKDRFYFFNAGEQGRITYFMDKKNIANLAEKHGLDVLRTYIVKRGEIPEEIEYPVITKAVISTVPHWKDNVYICYSEQELKKAYSKMEIDTILLQKYIKKKNELCMEGFSVAGGKEVFIAIASSYEYLLPDAYSPYMTVRNFKNDELQKKLCTMFREIGFEGIYEIEFLIDQDDHLYFSEINFRNSTWSYAATRARMPLPVLWAEAMLADKVPVNVYKKIPEGFKAMVELDDYNIRVKGGKIGFRKWIGQMLACRCRYYLSIKDMAPIWPILMTKFRKQ